MISYIIVDDEPLARDGMRINCDQVPFMEHRGDFANALLASEYLLCLLYTSDAADE